LPGHELWGVASVVSDAVGDEPARVSGGGLGAYVDRDDVAGADPACPSYPLAQLQAPARALHRAFPKWAMPQSG